MFLIETDQVGRITNTGHNELLRQQHVIVRGLRINEGRVCDNTEAAAAEVVLHVQLPTIDCVLILIRGDNHVKNRDRITRLSGNDPVCSINSGRASLVLQNPTVKLATGGSCTKRRSRLISISALTWVRHIEQRLIDFLNADKVLYVFVEITNREVAIIAVIPLH